MSSLKSRSGTVRVGVRKEFSAWLLKKMKGDSRIVFLTGDLGFQAFEAIQLEFKNRFFNVGVAEQNMVLLAAGLASQGLYPICYSIAPFAVFRPYEQLRLNWGIHHHRALLVGNGGGYGYGIMGSTHHALEDIAVISAIPDFKCFIPVSNEDLDSVADAALKHTGPAYLRLGHGTLPAGVRLSPFAPLRKLREGSKATLVTLGPITLNGLEAVQNDIADQIDHFSISVAPIDGLTSEFVESVKKTGKLVVVEEHRARGGVGEMLALELLRSNISCQLVHLPALGYPDHRYGSQKFHQKASGLDAVAIGKKIRELIQS